MGSRHGDVDPELAEKARYLRTHPTEEEKKLWYGYLKKCPYTFNRQYVFPPYIVDFYCEEKKLVIEVDGSQHYEEKGLRDDAKRTAYLEKTYSCRVIRFSNREVNQEFEGVCTQIENVLKSIRS